MSIALKAGRVSSSSVNSQLPHRTLARSPPENISTLIDCLPHLGQRKTVGNFFLGM
jgi:hypothetical protein